MVAIVLSKMPTSIASLTLLSAVRKTIPIGMNATARQNKIGSIDEAVTSNFEAANFCCMNGESSK